jgi:ubiquitin-protein ligase
MFGAGKLRRLQNDYVQMLAMHERNGLIYVIAADGDPPERYVVGFRCRGVAEIDANDRPATRDNHRVELILTAEYPRIRPLMHWMTPIFHPNFNDQGDVCLKAWYPQQTLAELCEVLGELVQYKNYNTTSPLNMEAAMWAMRHRDDLPIDERSLFAPVEGQSAPMPVAQSIYQASVVVTGTVPIWSPPAEAAPAEELARFCENCGFEFEDTETTACPQCGTQRATL